MADSDGMIITVLVDARPIEGRYRRLAGNRLEVYTDRTRLVEYIGAQSVEDQARDMLTRIARREHERGLT